MHWSGWNALVRGIAPGKFQKGEYPMLQDLRFAIRQIAKSPGFAVTAVLTLALGIGANTAVFSVVNAVLLRALPYPDANRLLLLWSSAPSQGLPMFGSSPADYRVWRSDNHSFDRHGRLLQRWHQHVAGRA